MKSVISYFKQIGRDILSDVYSLKVSKLLSKKKYSQIPSTLDTFSKYQRVEIEDSPLIISLIQNNNTECLDVFLKQINYKQQVYKSESDDLKTLPLFLACMNNQQPIIDIMLKHGAKMDETNSLNQNLLHLSAIHISKKGIDIGLKHKVSPNLVDSYANLPLHYAARSGNLYILKQLLKATTVKYSKNVFDQYPLHLAIQSQSSDIAKLFLKDLKGIDRKKSNPLILASQQPSGEIVQMVLRQDPSLARMSDSNEMLAIHHAAMSGNQEAIKSLSTHTDINVVDSMGHTPLHLAVLQNQLGSVRTLVNLGANPSLLNVDKLNSLDLALHAKNQEIRKYLEIYGPKEF